MNAYLHPGARHVEYREKRWIIMSVLFVGNGINRCANVVPGWNELFARAINVDGFQLQHGLTPTLEYELNIQNVLAIDKSKTSNGIKKDIAAYLTRMQKEAPNGWEKTIHSPLLKCAPHTILTTNYDYFLERAANPNFNAGSASTKEWLYSRERYRDVPGHRIYHIHGEISVPTSICLGFEHYVGSIQFIRDDLTRGTAEKGTTSTGPTSASKKIYHLHDVLAKLDDPIKNRWYYHFFTDDIYILGFGLDAAEQDIWWLLNYRAVLKQKYPGLITNTITYLETDSEFDNAPTRQILENVLKVCRSNESEENCREVLQKYGYALARHNAQKQLLSQKKIQLKAFHVNVRDCTELSDIETSTSVNSVNWDKVYALRYQRALTVLKGK